MIEIAISNCKPAFMNVSARESCWERCAERRRDIAGTLGSLLAYTFWRKREGRLVWAR